MVPASDGGDDFIGIGGPDEGLWAFVMLGEEAVDGGLKVDERVENAAFEAAVGQPGEETLDGIEPGRRCRGEMEDETRMTRQPLDDLGMLVSGVIVEDDVDDLTGRNLGLDHIQESDELMVPMPLHALSDDRTVENIKSGEKRGGAIALIIEGHHPTRGVPDSRVPGNRFRGHNTHLGS